MKSLKPSLILSCLLVLTLTQWGEVYHGNYNEGEGNTILSEGNFVQGNGNVVVPEGSDLDIFGGDPFFGGQGEGNGEVGGGRGMETRMEIEGDGNEGMETGAEVETTQSTGVDDTVEVPVETTGFVPDSAPEFTSPIYPGPIPAATVTVQDTPDFVTPVITPIFAPPPTITTADPLIVTIVTTPPLQSPIEIPSTPYPTPTL